MGNQLLDRRHWLRAHGFNDNLFSPESWNAETDLHAVSSFVHPKNYESLVGTLKNPECHFISAPSGGGKSSLRKAIKSQLDASLIPKILTVEYLVDSYDEIADPWQHCHRIVALVNRALRRIGKSEVTNFKSASREEIFEKMVQVGQEAGFEAVYILVDNVITYADMGKSIEEQFTRILGLIKDYSLLSMGLRGVVFKFFLSIEFSDIVDNLYRNKLLKSLRIEWDRPMLEEILEQRLVVSCLDEKMRRSDFLVSTFEEMFDASVSSHIINDIVEFGYQEHSPRAMWQIGHYLLDEHFRYGELLRRYDELINKEELNAAMVAAKENIKNPQDPKVATNILAPSRKIIFISHTWAQEDKQFSNDLANALRKKNLDVWYDEDNLGVGDSLSDKISQIIGRCDFAVVVLSPNYFFRNWTKRELELLIDREITEGKKIVLPILHNITIDDVRNNNRHLSYRLAIDSSVGLDNVVERLIQAMISLALG